MAERGLSAWVVPSTDPHHSEYVAPRWRRRAFISGFDGSAGTVVVTGEQAGLWTDSRYFLQAAQQLAGSGIELFKLGEQGVPDWPEWLCRQLEPGARVGVNHRVFSLSEWQQLAATLAGGGLALEESAEDLVDLVWGEQRPAPPRETVRPHPHEYAGRSTADKLAELQGQMAERSVDAMLLCALDEIAWLLNLRGADVAYNPVFLAYLLVEPERARCFGDPGRFSAAARAALPANVTVEPYEDVGPALGELGNP